jgi:hypothetical protein
MSSDGMSERRDSEHAACLHERKGMWRRGTMLNVWRGVCLDCDAIVVSDVDPHPTPPKPETPDAA